MGRDFYDASFLFGKTAPDFKYLKSKINIVNMAELKERLVTKCGNLDFKRLAKDIEPFVFDTTGINRVLFFDEMVSRLSE